MASLTAEITTLKSQTTLDTSAIQRQETSLRVELDTLRRDLQTLQEEKAALEKTLVDERASKQTITVDASQSELLVRHPHAMQGSRDLSYVTQAKLSQERDTLLAEKTALTARLESSGAAPSGAAPASWESEKAALVQARDEALARVQVCILLCDQLGSLLIPPCRVLRNKSQIWRSK